jgi:hypothetical protein
MTMTPKLSKLILTCHILFSIGWLGAVAVFIALAITGIASHDSELARASYLAMEVSSWCIIVPFCLAAFVTGIIQSLGTKWGLFKHYWILTKLILTIVSTIILLVHLKPISELASIARKQEFLNSVIDGWRIRILVDAAAGFLVLATILTISVYKPWGRIRGVLDMEFIKKKSPGKYIAIGLLVFVVVGILLLHLLGHGMHDAQLHQMKMSR